MATVAGWIRQGWAWWREEIANLLPERLRLGTRPAIVVAPPRDGPGEWMLLGRRAGTPVAALGARERSQAVIALPPDYVLCPTIDVPSLSRAEIKAMLAFDIDRLAPFPAGAACFDHEVVQRAEGGQQARIRIGVLPLERARGWVQAARAAGLDPRRMAMQDADGRLHFDFLAALGEETHRPGAAPWFWGLVALLFTLNVAMLVWRDVASVAAMRDAVEEQASAGRTALALRQRLEREQRRRADLVRSRARGEPLRVIGIVGGVLPPAAWTQRLNWDGSEVRLVGYVRGGDTDLTEALGRSPMLRGIRENEGEGASAADGQAQPFDISARVVPGAVR